MSAQPASRWGRLARGLAEGAALAGAFWLAHWAYSDLAPLPSGWTIAGVTALSAVLLGLSRLLSGGILGAVIGALLGGMIAWEVVGRHAPAFLDGAGPNVGKPARVNGPTLDGGSFDITQHKGKVVVVDFWATWCAPCVAEMPDLVRLYHRYNAEGLEVVGVSHDRSPDELERYVRQNNLPWPQIIHPEPEKRGGNNPNALAYQVESLPWTMVVDREGTIVAEGVRGEGLRRAVEQALRGRGQGGKGGVALFALFVALGWLAGVALEWSFRQPTAAPPSAAN
jgi:thiol-disulfide isomerase/thioredoxin